MFSAVVRDFACFKSGGGFGFLFEKMSKLRGVENAHRWRHMVRLTQRSTSFGFLFQRSTFNVVRRFNGNMSVYLYMLIFGPLKGLPLNTFENYGMAS